MLYQVGAELTPLASFLPKNELETDVPGFFDESLRPMTIKVEIPDPNRLGYMHSVVRGILIYCSWET